MAFRVPDRLRRKPKPYKRPVYDMTPQQFLEHLEVDAKEELRKTKRKGRFWFLFIVVWSLAWGAVCIYDVAQGDNGAWLWFAVNMAFLAYGARQEHKFGASLAGAEAARLKGIERVKERIAFDTAILAGDYSVLDQYVDDTDIQRLIEGE